MPLLRFYLGDKGDDGADGIDGFTPADAGGSLLSQPLLDSFIDNKISKSANISSTILSHSSYVDRYGRNEWSNKEEYTNYVPFSNDFSQWDDISGRWSVIGATIDPLGGSDAVEINLDVDTDVLATPTYIVEDIVTIAPLNGCISFYIKTISGDVTGLDITVGSDTHTLPPPTSEYMRVVFPLYIAGAFILSINPRGKTGARVALYGAQVEDNLTARRLIVTNGAPVTKDSEAGTIRQSDKGVLIESGKTNETHFSNDLSKWSIDNGTIEQSPIPDAFGHVYQSTRVVFGSLPNIEISTTTDALDNGETYTVSFWAYNTGGSLSSIIVSLGAGADVDLGIPPVSGFERMSAKCVTNNTDELIIKLESLSLNAQLLISSVQIEKDNITSYIQTGPAGVARIPENFNMAYDYNFPSPALSWSLVFGKEVMIDNSDVKTIFSNGEAGSNEFSLSYQNRLLTLNMGGNTITEDMYDFRKVALVFDGAQVKFYGEKVLISTQSIAPSSFISALVYIGYNGTDEYINSYLSNFMAYNVALTENEIIYLLGV